MALTYEEKRERFERISQLLIQMNCLYCVMINDIIASYKIVNTDYSFEYCTTHYTKAFRFYKNAHRERSPHAFLTLSLEDIFDELPEEVQTEILFNLDLFQEIK